MVFADIIKKFMVYLGEGSNDNYFFLKLFGKLFFINLPSNEQISAPKNKIADNHR